MSSSLLTSVYRQELPEREFGIYIGPDLDSDDDEDEVPYVAEEEDEESAEAVGADDMDDNAEEVPQNQVVLHEDKKYYSTALQIYGGGVKTLVQEEDAPLLTEPIIGPIAQRKLQTLEHNLPKTTYNKAFLADLMDCSHVIRNVAFAGHLHHGKTTYLDCDGTEPSRVP